MSSGTTSSDRLTEALDAAVNEDVQQGRLDDTEIQRLVVLSRDASYQRSERVPVKTVEAFEPRSLVSIAMDAQRRRETEMRTAAAAGAMVDSEAVDAEPVEAEPTGDEPPAEASASGSTAENTGLPGGAESENAAADDAGRAGVADGSESGDKADAEGGEDEATAQGTSQIDFEAGRAEGLEEGRKSGLEEGHARGLEEGRAAGRAEASAQLERAIQAFEAAAGKLGGLTEIDSSALGESIHNTILTLASERAGRAIAEQPDAFADRIEGLLAAIRTASGQPVIHLNPGDLGSIQPLVETREKLRHCSFVAAPDLAAGDLTVTVGTIGIDDILLPAAQRPDPSDDMATGTIAAEVPASQAPDSAAAAAAGALTPHSPEVPPDAAAQAPANLSLDAEVAGDNVAGDEVVGDMAEPGAATETRVDDEAQAGDPND